MVALAATRSSTGVNRCTAWLARSPYGIGWRTATTLRPAARRISATRLVVWLLPAPVRTAHTATTGTEADSSVCRGPRRPESRPGPQYLGGDVHDVDVADGGVAKPPLVDVLGRDQVLEPLLGED